MGVHLWSLYGMWCVHSKCGPLGGAEGTPSKQTRLHHTLFSGAGVSWTAPPPTHAGHHRGHFSRPPAPGAVPGTVPTTQPRQAGDLVQLLHRHSAVGLPGSLGLRVPAAPIRPLAAPLWLLPALSHCHCGVQPSLQAAWLCLAPRGSLLDMLTEGPLRKPGGPRFTPRPSHMLTGPHSREPAGIGQLG